MAMAMQTTRGEDDPALARARLAVTQAPDEAEAHLGLGNALLSRGRPREALGCYQRALELRPAWAPALTNLGVVLKDLGQIDEAHEIQAFVCAHYPDFVTGFTNLGFILQRLGRFAEAVEPFRRAVTLDPAAGGAWANLGQALQQARREDEAAAAFTRAVTLAPDHPTIRYNYSQFLLQQGDYARGWSEFGWRRKGGVRTLPPRPLPQPVWDGTMLAGRTLLLYAEQGLGDTIQFIRFVERIAKVGGRIVVEAQKPLLPLLRPIAAIDQLISPGDPLPPIDCHLPLLSLPEILGPLRADPSIAGPYLVADPARRALWRPRLERPGHCRIGLTWAGNPGYAADSQRSIDSALLIDSLDAPGLALFSLQKDLRPGDAEILAARADRVTPLGPDLRDFVDTAAVIAELDLLICVDSAVPHLAGALGRPAWVLSRYAPDWRWNYRHDDSPWYPSLRLFHQNTPLDWPEVLTRVKAALAARV